ncbi:ATP-binding protein [Candidatus Ruminimicrobium bovinum]|uniref:ATP-binding protein n=1 Tax=Candidatus Ruminimicrobium bovinum TaxID=3242779 RepID=UPI0039B93681
MYKERTISKIIKRASSKFKTILLTGARQVGKTTCLAQIKEKNRQYITFDDPMDMAFAKEQPKAFFENNKTPLLLDEIQYVPELFRYIKMVVDVNNSKGQIWLTGSQQFNLMKNVTESLAGRVAIFNILGFSVYELFNKADKQKPFLPKQKVLPILKTFNTKETFNIIWKGFFPEICSIKNSNYIDWKTFYSSYVKTYIERDVSQLINVSNKLTFIQFLKVIASRTAQELNLSDISRLVGITSVTAKSWLSILQTSGIIYLLQPYYKNISKRILKSPKIYFTDTGLCCYLLGLNSPEILYNTLMSGHIFETFVVMEIIKSYIHNGETPEFYFYRDSNQVEIDLLIYTNGYLYPVEIKQTSNPIKEDINNFRILNNLKEKIGYGSLICLTDKPRALTSMANAISIWNI